MRLYRPESSLCVGPDILVFNRRATSGWCVRVVACSDSTLMIFLVREVRWSGLGLIRIL